MKMPGLLLKKEEAVFFVLQFLSWPVMGFLFYFIVVGNSDDPFNLIA